MFTPIDVKALAPYRLWIEYADGVRGEIDLAYLAGRGVFTLWNDEAAFRQVKIGDGGELVWNDEVDLCADALYLKMTGKSPGDILELVEQVYAGLSEQDIQDIEQMVFDRGDFFSTKIEAELAQHAGVIPPDVDAQQEI